MIPAPTGSSISAKHSALPVGSEYSTVKSADVGPVPWSTGGRRTGWRCAVC